MVKAGPTATARSGWPAAAIEGGATWLAVALVEEGRQLRAAGIDAPVLLLSEPTAPADGRGRADPRSRPTLYTAAGVTPAAEAVAAAGPSRCRCT